MQIKYKWSFALPRKSILQNISITNNKFVTIHNYVIVSNNNYKKDQDKKKVNSYLSFLLYIRV